MKKQNWYGLLGFLSLLGWIGVFTQERVFLLFFAFAVDFQYFFLPSDEMLEESMARCAARGFLFGVLSMAAAVLLGMAAGLPVEATLAKGCVLGFGIAVMVYELSSAYYGFRESRGMIKNRIRELRARHQMKQEELARRVGVRRETIGNLEKGRYNPSLVLAWKIAAVFGVSIEEVFTVIEEEEKSGQTD